MDSATAENAVIFLLGLLFIIAVLLLAQLVHDVSVRRKHKRHEAENNPYRRTWL